MALTDVFLRENSPFDNEVHRQQACKMSIAVSEHFRVEHGSCICICLQSKAFICKAYLLDTCKNYIHYSSNVSKKLDALTSVSLSLEEDKKLLQVEPNRTNVKIKSLPLKDAEEVVLRIVVKTPNYDRLVSNTTYSCEGFVQACVLDLCVAEGYYVDFTGCRDSYLIGLCGCVVETVNIACEPHNREQAYRVTSSTQIKVTGIESVEHFRSLSDSFPALRCQLGGLEKERRLLTSLLTATNPGAVAVLLQGPPGVGKTSLVRQVAEDCGGMLLEVHHPDILSSGLGETEASFASVLRKAERLCQEAPCLVLIDQADCLFSEKPGKRGAGKESSVTAGLLLQLEQLGECDRGLGLLVCLLTSRPAALDPALRSNGIVCREISLEVPGTKQRRQILDVALEGLTVEKDVDADWLSSVTSGCVGADISLLCKRATEHAVQRNVLCQNTLDWKVKQSDIEAALQEFKPSLQRGVESIVDLSHVPWSSIGGLQDIKEKIQQAVEWPLRFPEVFQRLGLPLTRGLLLTGPPGCGKTLLARAAASACRVTFLSLSCAQVFSPYVGDSEKKLSETFQKARSLAPSILFLDEIDALVGKRSDTGSGVSDRVLSTLLNEMDGVGFRMEHSRSLQTQVEGEGEPETSHIPTARERIQERRDGHVLVIAATNRLDMIDSALLRPGRIDHVIHVPPPDLAGRQQAFEVHTRSMPLAEDVNLLHLAHQTPGFTGADVKVICKEAGLLALEESMAAECVMQGHFLQALKDFSPVHRVLSS